MAVPSNGTWWIRLVSPHPSFTEPERRRQSQLLSILSAVLLPLITFTLIANMITSLPQSFIGFTALLLPLMLLFSSCSRYNNNGSLSIAGVLSKKRLACRAHLA